MTAVKVLLVENDPEDERLFLDFFPYELEKVGITAEWDSAGDWPTARKKIQAAEQSGTPIDVAIVDLFLIENSLDQTGALVLRQTKDSNERAYVLLVTASQHLAPTFKDDYDAETSRALVKNEISAQSRWSWSELAREIRQHLVDIGRLTMGEVTYEEEDAGIISVLEEVGRGLAEPGGHKEGAHALRVLAFKCLRDQVSDESDVNIGFLTAGRSGASVCRLDVSRTGEPTQSFVLKFGVDRRALEQELERNTEAGKVLEQSSLMAIKGNLGSDGRRYHAITARTANRAVSLRKWLTDQATIEDARTVAQMVLVKQLGPLFRSDGRSESGTNDWIALRPGRKLRALAAIERYGNVLADPRTAGTPHGGETVQLLSAFVNSNGQGAGPVNSQRSVVFTRVFGDLHSGNVLVQPDTMPLPVLIDASLYGRGHWSSDNARLLVDLLLRVRKPGVESMLWPCMAGDDEELIRLCPFCQSQESLEKPQEQATEAFIAQAVQLLPDSTRRKELSIPRDVWHWEWHVALVRELLRQAAHEDLTPPRACLALAAAGEHLRTARNLAEDSGLT